MYLFIISSALINFLVVYLLSNAIDYDLPVSKLDNTDPDYSVCNAGIIYKFFFVVFLAAESFFLPSLVFVGLSYLILNYGYIFGSIIGGLLFSLCVVLLFELIAYTANLSIRLKALNDSLKLKTTFAHHHVRTLKDTTYYYIVKIWIKELWCGIKLAIPVLMLIWWFVSAAIIYFFKARTEVPSNWLFRWFYELLYSS